MVKHTLSLYAKKRSAPLRILEIGCGTGLLLEELAQFGTAEGIDISPRAIQYCKQRGLSAVSQGDAAALPFGDALLDVVVMLDVLEHVKDDKAVCREIARVLAPGGLAIIMVPAVMFLWGITDVLSQHIRRYTKKEVQKKLQDAGLMVENVTYFNTFLFPLIAAIRIGVRVLGIRVQSESNMGGPFGNFLFYYIFYFESVLLRYMNFPFGVSILLITTKK
jgi:SAM-dependent methyltransferase